jgi:hypothetical protein
MDIWNAKFDGETMTITHPFGFLSCASVTLYNLLRIHRERRDLITVAWDKAEVKSIHPEDNIKWEDFPGYYLPPAGSPPCLWESHGNREKPYVVDISEYEFSHLKMMADIYFRPNQRVLDIVDKWVKEYDIDFQNTTFLRMRGTNKMIDTPRIHHKFYIKELQRVRSSDRVLLQTDDKEIYDRVMPELGDRGFSFPEFSREEAHMYLATVIIASRCARVVCDSGNYAFWVCIYRGHTYNVSQLYSSYRIVRKS